MSRSFIIDGSIIYTNYSQIIGQSKFEELLREFVDILKEKQSPLLNALNAFKVNSDYDVHRFTEYLHLLTMRNIKEIGNIIYYVNPKDLERFIEAFYTFWRSKHRFMVRNEKYAEDYNRRASIEYTVTMIGDQFKATIKNLYRELMMNVSNTFPTVMRQLPSGAQVMFLIQEPNGEKYRKMNG